MTIRHSKSHLKFRHMGALLGTNGKAPHIYDISKPFPSGNPGNRDPAAPPLPLPPVSAWQLAKPSWRKLARRQARGARAKPAAPHRVRMPDLSPPLSLARRQVLRGADGRFGTALYARGQIRALAFLPLSPRSRDTSFQRPGPRRHLRPLRNQRSRCHRLWKQRLPGRTLMRWRLDSTNSCGLPMSRTVWMQSGGPTRRCHSAIRRANSRPPLIHWDSTF